MRRFAMLLLVLAVVSAGCSSLTLAVDKTGERIQEATTDPIRRTHLFTQAGMTMGTVGVGIGCALLIPIPIVGLVACPVLALVYDYLVYEYIAEPVSKARVKSGEPSLVGPYWERGPQDGEQFICEGITGGRWDHGKCVDQITVEEGLRELHITK